MTRHGETTGQSPQHHSSADPFAVARELLQAEASRRGIGVRELVGRLAREGRRPFVPVDPAHRLSDHAWQRPPAATEESAS
ncbi:hypothetical protein [Streptomyces sp. bgisy153]|uniref:hypothetical protein n=1 Tax=Streptomyces sp. bgisy153 TaxID=3413793 RepID=UPI003D705542